MVILNLDPQHKNKIVAEPCTGNHMVVTWGRKQVDPRVLWATNLDESVSFRVDEKTFQINEVETDRENHPSSAYDLHMHLHR